MSIVPHAVFVDDFGLSNPFSFATTLRKSHVVPPPTTVPVDFLRPAHHSHSLSSLSHLSEPALKQLVVNHATLPPPKQQHHHQQLHPQQPPPTATSAPSISSSARKLGDGKQVYTSTSSTSTSTTASDAGIPTANLNREEAQVDKLVDSTTFIVQAIWPTADPSPPPNNHGQEQQPQQQPVLPLRCFIRETLKRSRTSHSTLHVALYYLVLLHQRLLAHGLGGLPLANPQQANVLNCGRRMFLSALILASKYLQDRNFSARAWSKISGLATQEINQNETVFLLAIDWKLHIPEPVFRRWSRIVLDFARCPRSAAELLHAAGREFVGGRGRATSANAMADSHSTCSGGSSSEYDHDENARARNHAQHSHHVQHHGHHIAGRGEDGFLKYFEFCITLAESSSSTSSGDPYASDTSQI